MWGSTRIKKPSIRIQDSPAIASPALKGGSRLDARREERLRRPMKELISDSIVTVGGGKDKSPGNVYVTST